MKSQVTPPTNDDGVDNDATDNSRALLILAEKENTMARIVRTYRGNPPGIKSKTIQGWAFNDWRTVAAFKTKTGNWYISIGPRATAQKWADHQDIKIWSAGYVPNKANYWLAWNRKYKEFEPITSTELKAGANVENLNLAQTYAPELIDKATRFLVKNAEKLDTLEEIKVKRQPRRKTREQVRAEKRRQKMRAKIKNEQPVRVPLPTNLDNERWRRLGKTQEIERSRWHVSARSIPGNNTHCLIGVGSFDRPTYHEEPDWDGPDRGRWFVFKWDGLKLSDNKIDRRKRDQRTNYGDGDVAFFERYRDWVNVAVLKILRNQEDDDAAKSA